MIRLGTTTLSMVGWLADPSHPGQSQRRRLDAIRRAVQDLGLSAVELTLDLPLLYPTVFDTNFYQAVGDLRQELGFTCTAHLPFLWIEPASVNEAIRRASVHSLLQAVQLTQGLVDTYVLHLWGLATTQIVAHLENPAEREAIMAVLVAQASRSLAELCETIEPRDICVENLEDSLFGVALALADRHDTSLCFDVGHMAWQDMDALDFLRQHGDRIREVHLHDATREPPGSVPPVRDHLALGQGQIDYQAILIKLEEMGYGGPVILELNSEADLRASLAELRKAR
ncbi:MAG: cobamide remodeling phosphodiesterase CbiR [Anaerolineae bacterium]